MSIFYNFSCKEVFTFEKIYFTAMMIKNIISYKKGGYNEKTINYNFDCFAFLI